MSSPEQLKIKIDKIAKLKNNLFIIIIIITLIINFKLALVAQRIERSPAKAEVGGSIPLKRATLPLPVYASRPLELPG